MIRPDYSTFYFTIIPVYVIVSVYLHAVYNPKREIKTFLNTSITFVNNIDFRIYD